MLPQLLQILHCATCLIGIVISVITQSVHGIFYLLQYYPWNWIEHLFTKQIFVIQLNLNEPICLLVQGNLVDLLQHLHMERTGYPGINNITSKDGNLKLGTILKKKEGEWDILFPHNSLSSVNCWRFGSHRWQHVVLADFTMHSLHTE